MSRRFILAIIAVLTISGCSGSTAAPQPAPPGAQGVTAPAPGKTLTILTHVEPGSLAEHRALYTTSADANDAKRLFNASFYLPDLQGVSKPILLEKGPELHTDSWRVNADGTMDTVYRLKPNLTWHDGAPLVADDFVLSWQMAKQADYGIADLKPMNIMEEATALDAHTVSMRWKTTYPAADALSPRDWSPVPSHLLRAAFESDPGPAVMARPYWTSQFVGLGPFKMVEWQPGAFISGVAFDNYAMGKPKVDKIELRFAGDANTAAVTILAGQAHLAIDRALAFEQANLLQRQWGPQQSGSVLLIANNLQYIQTQYRPEYINPPEVRDPRVRQALHYAIDKQGLLDGLMDGQGQSAEGFLVPGVDYYERALREITKYPRDLTQADRLMQSAGLVKQADRSYQTSDGRRFGFELRGAASDQDAREAAINANAWKELGIDVQTRLLSTEEVKDGELRSNYPAFIDADTAGIAEDTVYVKLYSLNAASAATRWQGSNRGGHVNPEYDRFFVTLTTNLERSAQVDAIVQAAKFVSEQVPVIPLYYSYNVKAHVSALKGPQTYAPTGHVTWGIEQWTFAG